MSKRTINFNIIMNTSVRGRGKWGDFLVALIPVTWCCNILINSNFILRMIEWQNESSLFTIRIQGKQWYWVYKYDPNTAQAVICTPKNIGHDRWRVVSGQESYNADTYYQAIHLAAHLEFQDSYSKFTTKTDTNKKTLNKLSLANEKLVISTGWINKDIIANFNESSQQYSDIVEYSLFNSITENPITENYPSYVMNLPNDLTKLGNVEDFSTIFENKLIKSNKKFHRYGDNINLTLTDLYYNSTEVFFDSILLLEKFKYNQNFNAYYDFIQLDETADVDSNNRHNLSTQPFRLMRGVLNQHVTDILQSSMYINSKLSKPLLFSTKYTQSGETLRDKELLPETLWGFRQKKYKKVKKFKFKPEVIYDPITFKVIGHKPLPSSPKIDIAGLDLQNININTKSKIEGTDHTFKTKSKSLEDNFNYRISSKIARHRSELVPVTLARRLLRTKRTLVLPAHVNLTLITNSYDVVHSWFVPGLGLKLDCVPGRSTHHTFYVDNIGFYYGQCAEICGRYHHHMPIRLCALPFQHFVVWWQSKGLARLNRTTEINRNKFFSKNFSNNVTKEKLISKMN